MNATQRAYVYLFATSTGPCKIGISKNPEARLRSFRRSGHFDLRMEAVWDAEFARTLELAAHRELAASRIAGEWFAVPVDAARETVGRLHKAMEAGELRPSVRVPGHPTARDVVAKKGSAASIESRQVAIRKRLDGIKLEWLRGVTRTSTLLHQADVSYGVARRELGPRRKYSRHQQPQLFERTRCNTGAQTEKARTQAACKCIADRWKSGTGTTPDLLREAGVSRNTALLYLGKRPPRDGNPGKRRRRSTWIGPAFSAVVGDTI